MCNPTVRGGKLYLPFHLVSVTCWGCKEAPENLGYYNNLYALLRKFSTYHEINHVNTEGKIQREWRCGRKGFHPRPLLPEARDCGCRPLSRLALCWETEHPPACSEEEPTDPTHFSSRGSLVSPALGPEEPLCSVAKWLGWAPHRAGKLGQPTSQPVFTLTGLEVQAQARSQPAGQHASPANRGQTAWLLFSVGMCCRGSFRCGLRRPA